MDQPENIFYQNVPSTKIRQWFAETLVGYPELSDRPIYLRKLAMKRSTMRAQPIINRSFFRRKTRHYRVDLSAGSLTNLGISLITSTARYWG